MATLIQQYAIGNDTLLRARAGAALARTANDVRNEDPTGQTATETAKRQALAVACRLNVESVVAPAARLLAENATVQAACTFGGSGLSTTVDTSAVADNDILFVLAQQWDVLAGVLPSED